MTKDLRKKLEERANKVKQSTAGHVKTVTPSQRRSEGMRKRMKRRD
jgi:hypothetical protein